MTQRSEIVRTRSFLPRTESMVLYVSMFVMGGCGLAYEYTLSKLSSDLLGNSVEQWAIIIGVMMFFMGVGSDVQKHLKDEDLLTKFLLAEIVLGLCGAFGPIAILDAYGRFPSHFVLIQYFFIGAIGLLIGFEIPLLTRINARYSHEIRVNIGGILKMDYVGALCGALAWVFVLPKFFSTTEMAFVLGLLTLATSAMAFLFFFRLLEHPAVVGGALVLATGLVLSGYAVTDVWTSHAEQALYRDRILYSATSKHQHAVLTGSRAGTVSLFINGHLQFSSDDEHIYHENLVHPAMLAAERRERVLILGGGDGLAAREVLKYPDVRSVTLCDIDPMIVELARTHPRLRELNRDSLRDARLWVIDNQAMVPADERQLLVPNQNALTMRELHPIGRIRVINIDALKFVEQISGKYDVVILDFPDPNAPELAKLYSRSFYQLLRKRLSAGGVMVQQATSPYYAKEAYLNIGRTIASAGFATLPYHDTVPSMGDWGWWLAGDRIWHTRDGLRTRLKERDLAAGATAYLTKQRIEASLAFGAGQLTTERTDINTITSVAVYEYYVQGWERYF